MAEIAQLQPTFVVMRWRNNMIIYSGIDEDAAANKMVRGTVCGMDMDPHEALCKAGAAAQVVRAGGKELDHGKRKSS